jgi:hypothetical protein
MITFTCANCRQTLSVPEANAGKKGKCPQCGSIVDIPMTTAEAFPPPPPPVSEAAPMDFVASPHVEPTSGGHRQIMSVKDPQELLIPSFILAGLAFLASPYAVLIKGFGTFPSVIIGLACMGLAGFALTLAIIAMLKATSQKLPLNWYSLSALIVSGVSVFVSLMMFIASFTGR